MTPIDKYFIIAAKIWEAYFETRKGKRFGENAVSRTKREELLEELRVKLLPKESRLDDRELMRKIQESRAKRLQQDVKDAFK